ncbi:MAG: acyltransferase domain-containing protein [Candidatus Aminicenantes bacterium]|nr:acyltransferase domain-containing protein [Candidatus Aminicenantes bacterium]
MSDHGVSHGLEVAVIGMGGRFPGAKNIDEFWTNLKNGVESISFFSDEELKKNGVDTRLSEHPNYVKAIGGILEDWEYFDSAFFGYSPKEAEVMAPQVRILHECAWEALEDAGCDPDTYDGSIGLYAGASSSANWEALARLAGKSADVGEILFLTLANKDQVTSRISHSLNLTGPSFSIQTACSTSLIAIHLACQGILSGECEIALAGGITVELPSRQGYINQDGDIMSSDGHIRAFDARASGTIWGNGAGIVVLKSLEDALADRDYIYAVIKGSAINNDGNGKVGYSAPALKGQALVIRSAICAAEVGPEDICYVETHGTGTTLGDSIEIEALKEAFNSDKKNFCALGSLKTNVGHMASAAGIGGFIKTVLALQHRLIPPSLNFETPNPEISLENSPFYVNTELSEWKSEKNPLIAGISSFALGGSNAHVILEEAPKKEESGESREWQLILLSARTESALNRVTGNITEYLKRNPGINLADVAYTLKVRRAFQNRRMVVSLTVEEAVYALSNPGSRKVQTFLSEDEERPVVFIFPGLGSQYVNMGVDLYRSELIFRKAIDRCFEILKDILDDDVKNFLYPGEEYSGDCSHQKNNNNGISRFEIDQLIIFIFEYALAELLMTWGIKPHAIIGYSFGEYTAAQVSGVFSLEDALKLIVNRGKLIRQVACGAMLSVPLPAKELKPFLNDELSLAIDNGDSCVAAGPEEVIAVFEKQMKEKRYICMRVQNSYALHSKMMAPILQQFEEKVGQIHLKEPQIPYISNLTGTWITSEEATSPGYWSRHLRETVRFADGIEELVKKESNAVFIEIGPGRALSTMVSRFTANSPGQEVINLVRPCKKSVSDLYFLLNKIGHLWLNGLKIDWKSFYKEERRYRVPLPTYPFERQRYWIDEDSLSFDVGILAGKSKSKAAKKPDIADWFYLPAWKPNMLPVVEKGENSRTSCWVVFSAGGELSFHLSEWLEQDNQDVVVVEKGVEFCKVAKGKYTVNPGSSNDYHLLFNDISALSGRPGKVMIVHMWCIQEKDDNVSSSEWLEECQELGFFSLIHLAHAIGKQDFNTDVRITVVTYGMQGVYGEYLPYPEKATLLGPVNLISQEYPNIDCCAVDVDLPGPGSCQWKVLAEQLVIESLAGLSDRSVVYRGSQRLVQAFEPVKFNKSTRYSRLKEEGVYLITGGLGGLGLLLAEHLAERVRARLILVGRSAFPSRDEWEQWCSSHPEEDTTTRKIRKLQKIERMGARVMVLGVDVSNKEKLEEAMERAKGQFGQINGVIHAALQVDGAVIHRLTREMVENVFKSKVTGTLILDEVLQGEPLDFFILFSSLSSIGM